MAMHHFKLSEDAYDYMSQGGQIMELRLRKPRLGRLKVGDLVQFSQSGNRTERIVMEVAELYHANDWETLAVKIPIKATFWKNATALVEDMKKCYTATDARKHGVIGIRYRAIT